MRRLTLLCTAAVLACGPARADDPALAQSLYGALRLLLGAPANPDVTASKDGDVVTLVTKSAQYKVGEPPMPLALTYTLRAKSDGTYAIEGESVPSPLVFSLESKDAKGKPMTVSGSIAMPPMTVTGLIDPALKAAQTYDARLEGLTGTIMVKPEGTAAANPVPMSVATTRVRRDLSPVVGGRADVASNIAVTGIKAEVPDSPPAGTPPGGTGTVSVTIASIDGNSVTHGADPATASDAAQMLAAALDGAKRENGTVDPDKFRGDALRPLMAVLGSAGHDGLIKVDATDIAVSAKQGSGALHHFGLSEGWEPGKAGTRAYLEMSAAGLTAPVPEEFAAFVPQSMVLRPALHGIDPVKLSHLLELVTAQPVDNAAAMAAAMDVTTTPGAAFAIEALHVDLKDTSLDAHGEVHRVAGGPIPAAADMEIRVRGFEALLDKLNALPQAQEAIPALIYAKGLSKTDGDTLVWLVHAEGAAVTVNGVTVFPVGGTAAPKVAPGAPKKG